MWVCAEYFNTKCKISQHFGGLVIYGRCKIPGLPKKVLPVLCVSLWTFSYFSIVEVFSCAILAYLLHQLKWIVSFGLCKNLNTIPAFVFGSYDCNTG